MRNAALLGALLLMTIGCVQQRRRPLVCELPANYHGWVRVYFENQNCRPSPVREEVRVQVNSDGIGCTSEPFEEGAAVDEIFFRRADGGKRMLTRDQDIFGESIHRTTTGGREAISRDFFVGSRTDFSRAERPTP